MDTKSDIRSPASNAPEFGEALPISASSETLGFLTRRRSASALSLAAPGPSVDEVRTLLTIAARVPDHGKLAPWRFILFSGEAKARFVAGLEAIAAGRVDGGKLHAKLAKLRTPPLTIAVISRHLEGDIPEWEQRLSAGAVCMNLVTAAQATGYGANWITDWYAYDPEALALLGLGPGEKVAGYIFMGTPASPAQERERPDLRGLVTRWEKP